MEEYTETRGHDIWLTAIIAPFFTAVFVLLRMYTRLFVTKSTSLNDWIALATMPFIIAYSVLLAQATYVGMGHHQAYFDEKPEGKANNSKMYFWITISSEFYLSSLAGYKASLILLYLSIFRVHKTFRYHCYAALVFVLGYLIANIITEVAGCTPVQKTWNKDLDGHCIQTTKSQIFYGACNMFSDLWIAILPLPMIAKLQLKHTREKVGLAIVLGGGAIAFVVATVRYIYAAVDLTSKDRTWIAGMAFLWSVLEINTGLICSCTPALKPFLKFAKDKKQDWSTRRASRRDSLTAGAGGRQLVPATFASDEKADDCTTVRVPRDRGSPYTSSQEDSTLSKKSTPDEVLEFEQMIRRA